MNLNRDGKMKLTRKITILINIAKNYRFTRCTYRIILKYLNLSVLTSRSTNGNIACECTYINIILARKTNKNEINCKK